MSRMYDRSCSEVSAMTVRTALATNISFARLFTFICERPTPLPRKACVASMATTSCRKYPSSQCLGCTTALASSGICHDGPDGTCHQHFIREIIYVHLRTTNPIAEKSLRRLDGHNQLSKITLPSPKFSDISPRYSTAPERPLSATAIEI